MLTCSDVKQGDLTPSVAYKPNRILHLIKGHKYQMSCDEQSDSPNTNGFIFLSLNREWSLSLGIWQPYSKDWQSKSGTFTADRTGNFKLTPQVSKAIGTFKLRNFRLDDLTLGTNGGGQVSDTICTLADIFTLENGVITVQSETDNNSGIHSRIFGLTGGRTYKVTFDVKGSNMTLRPSFGWNRADDFSQYVAHKPSDDWVTCSGTITVPGTGVVPTSLLLFINGHSSVSVRNLTITGGGQPVNDGILRLHIPALGVTPSAINHWNVWQNSQSNAVALSAGHKYALTYDARLSGKDSKQSQSLFVGFGNGRFGWFGATQDITHDWQTAQTPFTATVDGPANSLQNYIFVNNNTPETWLEVRNMRLTDMSNGANLLNTNWYQSDGHEYVMSGATIFKD